MRLTPIALICALAVCAAAASVRAGEPPQQADITVRVSNPVALKVARLAADSLVARARPMPRGGRAWRSSIQAPHYQTDRDVGAASIGEGLLASYAVTRDIRYLRAAVAAGDFLLGVAEPAAGACAGRTGQIQTGCGRRRTSRASTTAQRGSATTSGDSSGSRTNGASGPEHSPACGG